MSVSTAKQLVDAFGLERGDDPGGPGDAALNRLHKTVHRPPIADGVAQRQVDPTQVPVRPDDVG